jgi:hypothetical protein
MGKIEELIRDVETMQLTDILKSDSVYTALRSAVKNPSRSGIDDCEDNYVFDLYDLCCKLRYPEE